MGQFIIIFFYLLRLCLRIYEEKKLALEADVAKCTNEKDREDRGGRG